MRDTMQVSLPTPSQHHQKWEGGSVPPLKLEQTDNSEPVHVRSAEALFEEPAERQKEMERARPTKKKAKALARAFSASPEVSGAARVGKLGWTIFCVAAMSVLAYFLFSRFVVSAVVIQGRSMQPTLKNGERYFLNRMRYFFTEPQRGDLVVLRDPGHNDFAIKRIVGGPDDWVNLRDGNVYLNGKRLVEPYLPTGVRTTVPDAKEKWILLGPNQYYVLGDNRANSQDSRYYGVIKRPNILGVLIK